MVRFSSLLLVVFLLFSLLSPILLEESRQPRILGVSDVILIGLLFLFNSEFLLKRLEDIGWSKNGLSLKFKIGKDVVELEDLDSTITERLRELEESYESLKVLQKSGKQGVDRQYEVNDSDRQPKDVQRTDQQRKAQISYEQEKILEDNIFSMLNSNLWIGRYTDTIAHLTSMPEDVIKKYCQKHEKIKLIPDEGRCIAVLKEREVALRKFLKSRGS